MKPIGGHPVLDLLIRLILTAFVAVVVPVVLGTALASSFSLSDQVLVGLLISTTGLLVQVIGLILNLNGAKAKEIELAEARDQSARVFAELRKYHDDLILSGNTLFAAYFARQLQLLAEGLKSASTRQELPIEQNMNTTEMMLAPFEAHPAEVVRAVHYLDDNDFFFELHARQFFHAVLDLVRRRRIKTFRRLFVYNDDLELSDSRTQLLLRFHRHQAHFEHRVMRGSDYHRLAKDSGLSGERLDFGVYGDVYLYRSASRGEVTGDFVAGAAAVREYQRFFDRAWSSPAAQEPMIEGGPVDAAALFERVP